jgi:hypothetical protein
LRAFAAVHDYAMTPGLHKKAWMATVRGRDAGRGAKESQVEHEANLSAAASRSKPILSFGHRKRFVPVDDRAVAVAAFTRAANPQPARRRYLPG